MYYLGFFLFTAVGAYPLHQQISLRRAVSVWQYDRGNLYIIQAIGKAAGRALEVNVFMVVLMQGTMLTAQGILGYSFIIQYFMNESGIQKSPKRTVHGDPVKMLTYISFQVSVRKGKILLQELV
jgi:hypothetical protein